MQKGNQHGGHEYDLHNWLDMTAHEIPRLNMSLSPGLNGLNRPGFNRPVKTG